MTRTVSILDRETLHGVREKVFRRQESTLADEARNLELADFVATIVGIRRDMRSLLLDLPDAAFVAQPDNDADELVWSAGQIILHTCDAATNTFGEFLRTAAGLPDGFRAPKGTGTGVYPLATRLDAVALLDACDRELADAFGSIPDNRDVNTEATVDPVGTTTIGGNLMIFAIHEDDHLGQLQELARRLS